MPHCPSYDHPFARWHGGWEWGGGIPPDSRQGGNSPLGAEVIDTDTRGRNFISLWGARAPPMVRWAPPMFRHEPPNVLLDISFFMYKRIKIRINHYIYTHCEYACFYMVRLLSVITFRYTYECLHGTERSTAAPQSI